jgi:hypothetical protein
MMISMMMKTSMNDCLDGTLGYIEGVDYVETSVIEAQASEATSAVVLAIWGKFMKAPATRMLMESNPDVRIMVRRNPVNTR